VQLNILVDVARRVIQQNDLPHMSSLVVADPYTVTSRALESMIRQYLPRKSATIPVFRTRYECFATAQLPFNKSQA